MQSCNHCSRLAKAPKCIYLQRVMQLYVSESKDMRPVSQMEATMKMMIKALRTGRIDAVIAFTSVLRFRSRPKSRRTRRALNA